MNKRVYGVLGISSIMANWNADFSGYPKTTSEGVTFGSDKALKYPIKKMWDNQGLPVLYIKSLRLDSKKAGEAGLAPRSLKERFEYIFPGTDLKKTKDSGEVLRKLFRAVDVKNFGATFAEAGCNISITGAVQIGQGLNKYEDTQAQEQSILSPFRDANKDEAQNSTLGTKIVSDEAHYFYPFVINPMAYREYVEMGVTEGYTQEDYENFKNTALVAATAFATNAKEGCENEFALFVETEETLYLPNLTEYITFTKGEKKNTLDLGPCMDLLHDLAGRIKAMEIYYRPETTVLCGNLEGVRVFHIVTQKEL